MQTTFLNAAGAVLFVRDDMEQGNWTQEEYTVNATFPFVAGKVIQRGQRISFHDPATNNVEVFEVRNVTNIEPEHYQQIIAEHIAVSELTDEHIDDKEITSKTPSQALTSVLSGTLWSVGTVDATNSSSADISRGSVWQAVCTIAQNWNVYIVPRITVNASGAITGRYLDIIKSSGVFRGLRLSIDKNMSDSSVVYDDSETLTALYGYGGSVDTAQSSGDDKQTTVTFKDVVWEETSSHPAKPAGQTYLEDPEATALYGRNGRPRFGYYQNGDITNPSTLLSKTWQALKQTNKPKISITGTVADLYRLGYKDQPIRLHDLAIVDISNTGEKFNLQIIRCDVDLIDPTATRPEIGAYIANIIYINRATTEASGASTSVGGGGGGGRGQSKSEYDNSKTYSAFEKTNSMIGMVVGTKNGNNYIKAGEICLAINETTGATTATINATHVNISATNTLHTLAGSILYDADGKLKIVDAGGLYVERTESGQTVTVGVWDKGNLTGGVMVQEINGQTNLKLTADVIDIDGLVTALAAKSVGVGSLEVEGEATFKNDIYCEAAIVAEDLIRSNTGLYIGNSEVKVLDASKSGNTLTIVKTDGSFTFSKAATLSAVYGGSNKGATATYKVTGRPSENFPSGAETTGTFTLHINSNAAWITDANGTVRARLANPADTDAAYKRGWNECIDAATYVTRYTRSDDGGNGGDNVTHYTNKTGSGFTGVGTGWYKTAVAGAYLLPSKK
jgi:phage minor structural protein